MPAVARVVVDIALDREFDYQVPNDLVNRVELGSRVTVPFGRSKSTGYVVGFSDQSNQPGLKSIASVVGDKPFVCGAVLDLVRWMSGYYCSTLEQAIRTVLPSAVRKKGVGFKKQLRVALVGECSVFSVQGEAGGVKLSVKQQAVVDLLLKKEGMFLQELTRELGITAAPVKSLEKKGLVTIEEATLARDPLAKKKILRTEPLELMPEQRTALDMINETIEACAVFSVQCSGGKGGAGQADRAPHVVLLHGVTGSGKTEVYMQAISRVLEQGKGAIVLVPEISLTPQTVERFYGRFGDTIAVLHSHLSQGERHDEWHRIRDRKARIVIGARSAVFAPVEDLGLIVVDEEHETSYKQEDVPRYSARDVAVMRGVMEPCAVVLGSATPALESWHNAKTGKYQLAELTHRVDHRKMPAMRVIDMRLEAERTGRVGVFSTDLLEAIRKRLDRAEQTILFLNRRGFATSLVCPKCGYVAKCDQCSVAYTYHRKTDELHCHICGGQVKVPKQCPECRDPSFKYSGMGTQRIESILGKCFPKAAIQRMDADMTTAKDAYERILGDFRVGKTDILVGTQMIAKGLHFPNVTLVGVVYADLSLHMPDFRAGERTFQLLAQVAGRAGRGEVAGEVIVQTYTPHHVAVQAARRLDYSGFCDQEIEFRRELSYPPFSHLVCLTVRGKDEDKALFCAQSLVRGLGKQLPKGVLLSDATAAPLAKARGFFRYQIMMRSPSVKTMTQAIRRALDDITFPKGILCSVDVDAVSLL